MTSAPVAGADTDPAGLLADHRPGSSFFFSSPDRTLLADGTRDGISLADALTHRPGLVVGALPFRPDAPERLAVPAAARWAGPARFGHARSAAPAARPEIRPVPGPGDYERAVEKALARLSESDLDKVVLARTLHLTAPESVDAALLLRNLAAGDPHGHVFAAPVPAGTLLGASPELLVSRYGRAVASHPLAGSAARSADPDTDRRRAAALLASAKDLREHAFVVDAVAEALRPFCDRLDVPERPSLVRTATMWHLGTRVTGRLADPGVSALALAVALHPTPAVCGTPAATARELIAELEPFDRGFYGGAVGWCDAEGDGEWAVAIRCAEAGERSLRLFAGAGIVPGSRPADELAETTAKFRTLLRALGLDEEDRRC
ncbi:isochorismate synthase [Spirillospora sp. CA-253888]